MEYPIKEKIKKVADDRNKTIVQLAVEIEKTDRWIHGIKSITDLTLEMIAKISKALAFDFLEDYNKWLVNHEQPPISMLAEPAVPYRRKEKLISVTMSIRGEQSAFGAHFGKLLDKVKKEGEIYGFEIE